MEYRATVPDKYFDSAIVDPPYGLGMKNFDSSKNRINSKTQSNSAFKSDATPSGCCVFSSVI